MIDGIEDFSFAYNAIQRLSPRRNSASVWFGKWVVRVSRNVLPWRERQLNIECWNVDSPTSQRFAFSHSSEAVNHVFEAWLVVAILALCRESNGDSRLVNVGVSEFLRYYHELQLRTGA